MKFVLSMAVPALLLTAAPMLVQQALAQDVAPPASPSAQTQQPSGGKSDQTMSAGTAGLQGAQTGQGYMNGPNGNGTPGNGAGAALPSNNSSNVIGNANSNMSQTGADVASNSRSSSMGTGASADLSPTYQGGRAAYRGKSESSLNKSEAEITAQLNQQQSDFAQHND
jgi:hypothetical protein